MTKTKVIELKPIYLIYSEQKYLVNEALTRLKKKITSQALGDLNIVEFSAPLNFEEVEQALYTSSFFEQKKAVIINQADRLTPAQIKKVEDYHSAVNPDVTLVLVAAKKSDAFFKRAKDKGFFFEYKSPKGGQLATWVIDNFATKDKKVNFEAASYLVNLLGADLSLLSNEIEKIALYYEQKDKLEAKDIGRVSFSHAHETIFDLVDALGQANLSLALTNLSHLFQNESEGMIFHMVVRQFRLLLKTKGLLSKGLSANEMARSLKLPSFVVSKYAKQARHFSTQKLVFAHSVLLDTEVIYKTTGTPLSKALELALIKILAGTAN